MNKQIPEFLIEKLNNEYGEKLSNKILQGYTKIRPVTLRVNTIKTTIESVKNILIEKNIDFSEVNWSNDALIINNVREDIIRELELYENGEIYLQSLSSMLPPIILKPQEKESILDMAAAPGGKTTQIAALTNNNASITACELNRIRAEKLKYNIEKQGATSCYVMVEDSRKLDDFFSFDKILLDAPCSGSGTINFEETDFEKGFTQKLIEKSVKSQKELIKKAIKILKPGCEMVYSTCSILKEENEEIVKQILKQSNVEIVPINIEHFNDLPLLPVTIKGTICVCPDELYEGFYIAKIRKKN